MLWPLSSILIVAETAFILASANYNNMMNGFEVSDAKALVAGCLEIDEVDDEKVGAEKSLNVGGRSADCCLGVMWENSASDRLCLNLSCFLLRALMP